MSLLEFGLEGVKGVAKGLLPDTDTDTEERLSQAKDIESADMSNIEVNKNNVLDLNNFSVEELNTLSQVEKGEKTFSQLREENRDLYNRLNTNFQNSDVAIEKMNFFDLSMGGDKKSYIKEEGGEIQNKEELKEFSEEIYKKSLEEQTVGGGKEIENRLKKLSKKENLTEEEQKELETLAKKQFEKERRGDLGEIFQELSSDKPEDKKSPIYSSIRKVSDLDSYLLPKIKSYETKARENVEVKFKVLDDTLKNELKNKNINEMNNEERKKVNKIKELRNIYANRLKNRVKEEKEVFGVKQPFLNSIDGIQDKNLKLFFRDFLNNEIKENIDTKKGMLKSSISSQLVGKTIENINNKYPLNEEMIYQPYRKNQTWSIDNMFKDETNITNNQSIIESLRNINDKTKKIVDDIYEEGMSNDEIMEKFEEAISKNKYNIKADLNTPIKKVEDEAFLKSTEGLTSIPQNFRELGKGIFKGDLEKIGEGIEGTVGEGLASLRGATNKGLIEGQTSFEGGFKKVGLGDEMEGQAENIAYDFAGQSGPFEKLGRWTKNNIANIIGVGYGAKKVFQAGGKGSIKSNIWDEFTKSQVLNTIINALTTDAEGTDELPRVGEVSPTQLFLFDTALDTLGGLISPIGKIDDVFSNVIKKSKTSTKLNKNLNKSLLGIKDGGIDFTNDFVKGNFQKTLENVKNKVSQFIGNTDEEILSKSFKNNLIKKFKENFINENISIKNVNNFVDLMKQNEGLYNTFQKKIDDITGILEDTTKTETQKLSDVKPKIDNIFKGLDETKVGQILSDPIRLQRINNFSKGMVEKITDDIKKTGVQGEELSQEMFKSFSNMLENNQISDLSFSDITAEQFFTVFRNEVAKNKNLSNEVLKGVDFNKNEIKGLFNDYINYTKSLDEADINDYAREYSKKLKDYFNTKGEVKSNEVVDWIDGQRKVVDGEGNIYSKGEEISTPKSKTGKKKAKINKIRDLGDVRKVKGTKKTEDLLRNKLKINNYSEQQIEDIVNGYDNLLNLIDENSGKKFNDYIQNYISRQSGDIEETSVTLGILGKTEDTIKKMANGEISETQGKEILSNYIDDFINRSIKNVNPNVKRDIVSKMGKNVKNNDGTVNQDLLLRMIGDNNYQNNKEFYDGLFNKQLSKDEASKLNEQLFNDTMDNFLTRFLQNPEGFENDFMVLLKGKSPERARQFLSQIGNIVKDIGRGPIVSGGAGILNKTTLNNNISSLEDVKNLISLAISKKRANQLTEGEEYLDLISRVNASNLKVKDYGILGKSLIKNSSIKILGVGDENMGLMDQVNEIVKAISEGRKEANISPVYYGKTGASILEDVFNNLTPKQYGRFQEIYINSKKKINTKNSIGLRLLESGYDYENGTFNLDALIEAMKGNFNPTRLSEDIYHPNTGGKIFPMGVTFSKYLKRGLGDDGFTDFLTKTINSFYDDIKVGNKQYIEIFDSFTSNMEGIFKKQYNNVGEAYSDLVNFVVERMRNLEIDESLINDIIHPMISEPLNYSRFFDEILDMKGGVNSDEVIDIFNYRLFDRYKDVGEEILSQKMDDFLRGISNENKNVIEKFRDVFGNNPNGIIKHNNYMSILNNNVLKTLEGLENKIINLSPNALKRFQYKEFAFFSEARNAVTGESLKENGANLIINKFKEYNKFSDDYITNNVIKRVNRIISAEDEEVIKKTAKELKNIVNKNSLDDNINGLVDSLVELKKGSKTENSIRNEIIERAIAKNEEDISTMPEDIQEFVDEGIESYEGEKLYEENLYSKYRKMFQEQEGGKDYTTLSDEEIKKTLSELNKLDPNGNTDYEKVFKGVIDGDKTIYDLLENDDFIKGVNEYLEKQPSYKMDGWSVKVNEEGKLVDVYSKDKDFQDFNGNIIKRIVNTMTPNSSLVAQAGMADIVSRIGALKATGRITKKFMKNFDYFKKYENATKAAIGNNMDKLENGLSISQYLNTTKAVFKDIVKENNMSDELIEKVIKNINGNTIAETKEEQELMDFLKNYMEDINIFRKNNNLDSIKFSDLSFEVSEVGVSKSEGYGSVLAGNHVFFTKSEKEAIESKFGTNGSLLFKHFTQNLLYGGLQNHKDKLGLGLWSKFMNGTVLGVQALNYNPLAWGKGANQFAVNYKNAYAIMNSMGIAENQLDELENVIGKNLNFDLKRGGAIEMMRGQGRWTTNISSVMENGNVLYQSDRASINKMTKASLSLGFADLFQLRGAQGIDEFIKKADDMDNFLIDLRLKHTDIGKDRFVRRRIADQYPDQIQSKFEQYKKIKEFYNSDYSDVLSKTRVSLSSLFVLDNIREFSATNIVDNYRPVFGLMKWAVGRMGYFAKSFEDDIAKYGFKGISKGKTIPYLTQEIMSGVKTRYNTEKLTEGDVSPAYVAMYSTAPLIAFSMFIGERMLKSGKTASNQSEYLGRGMVDWSARFLNSVLSENIIQRAYLYPSIIFGEVQKAVNTYGEIDWDNIDNPSKVFWDYTIKNLFKDLGARFLVHQQKGVNFEKSTPFTDNLISKMFQSPITKTQIKESDYINKLRDYKEVAGTKEGFNLNTINDMIGETFIPKSWSYDVGTVVNVFDEYVNEKGYNALIDDWADTGIVMDLIKQFNRKKAVSKIASEKKYSAEEIWNMDKEKIDELLYTSEKGAKVKYRNEAFDMIVNGLEGEGEKFAEQFFKYEDKLNQIRKRDEYKNLKEKFEGYISGEGIMEGWAGGRRKTKEKLEEDMKKFVNATISEGNGSDVLLSNVLQAQADIFDDHLKDVIFGKSKTRQKKNIAELAANAAKDRKGVSPADLYKLYGETKMKFENELIKRNWGKIKNNKVVGTILKDEMLKTDQDLGLTPVETNISLTRQDSYLKSLLFHKNFSKIAEKNNFIMNDKLMNPFNVLFSNVSEKISQMPEDSVEKRKEKKSVLENILNMANERISFIEKVADIDDMEKSFIKKGMAFSLLPVIEEFNKWDMEGLDDLLKNISDEAKNVIDILTDSEPIDEKFAYNAATGLGTSNTSGGGTGGGVPSLQDRKEAAQNYFKLLDAHNKFVDFAIKLESLGEMSGIGDKIKYNKVEVGNILDFNIETIDVEPPEAELDIETREGEIPEPEQKFIRREPKQSSVTTSTTGQIRTNVNSKISSRKANL